jgi:hypothetical protein
MLLLQVLFFEQEKCQSQFKDKYYHKAQYSKTVHSLQSLPYSVSLIEVCPCWYLNDGKENIKDDSDSNGCQ